VRPEHLALQRASTRPVTDRPDQRLASVCAHPRPLFWTRDRVIAALERFYRQTGLTPTNSNSWRRLSGQLTRGRPRSFPSPPVVLRYFGSFRAAWVSLGIVLEHTGAPWSEAEDCYLREQLGRQQMAAIARTLDRSVAGVKLRRRRLHRDRRVLDPPPPPVVEIVAGGWVRVVGPVPAAPWCLGRVGHVDQVV
jgi:hypothetical protein